MAISTDTNNPFKIIADLNQEKAKLTNLPSFDKLANDLRNNSAWAVAAGKSTTNNGNKVQADSNKAAMDISIWEGQIRTIDNQIDSLSREQDMNDGTGEGDRSAFSLKFSTDENPNEETRNTNTNQNTKNNGIIAELSAKRGFYSQKISSKINSSRKTIDYYINQIKQNKAIEEAKRAETQETIDTCNLIGQIAATTNAAATTTKTVVVPLLYAGTVTAPAAPVVDGICNVIIPITVATKTITDTTAGIAADTMNGLDECTTALHATTTILQGAVNIFASIPGGGTAPTAPTSSPVPDYSTLEKNIANSIKNGVA